MKKKLLVSLLLCVALCFSLCAAASAENSFVGDAAGLLSDEQRENLESACAAVAEQYDCGVYIVTVPDYRKYGSDVHYAAENIYGQSRLGVGADRNGVMLFLSMNDRDYDILAYGNAAHCAFTDYGKRLIAESFLDNFRNNDWYGGFCDFVREAGNYLEYAKQGTPVDVQGARASETSFAERLPIIIIAPCVVSLGVCFSMKKSMKNVRRQTEASAYVPKNGTKLHVSSDIFTHRTQSVQVIERSSSTGGHGGTSVNSRGYSHSSGKF